MKAITELSDQSIIWQFYMKYYKLGSAFVLLRRFSVRNIHPFNSFINSSSHAPCFSGSFVLPWKKTQVCVLSSLAGVFALGAVPHVLRVELHLDGDAVEPKFGVEQISGFLQQRLGVGAILWCGMRKQEKCICKFSHVKIEKKDLAPPPEGYVTLPMAR